MKKWGIERLEENDCFVMIIRRLKRGWVWKRVQFLNDWTSSSHGRGKRDFRLFFLHNGWQLRILIISEKSLCTAQRAFKIK